MEKENEASGQTGNTTNSKKIVTKCPFQLKPSQAKVSSILNQYKGVYINTFELRNIGIANPAQRISELKFMGAVIDTTYKPATDAANEEHPKTAHYRFNGWEV